MKLVNQTTKKALFVLSIIALYAQSAGATIDTANITDAIDLIGTVGSSFIQAMSTIFVDNLGTILTLVAVGIVIIVFGGFGKMIVGFMSGVFGRMGKNIK